MRICTLTLFALLLSLPVLAGGTKYDRLLQEAVKGGSQQAHAAYQQLTKDADPQVDAVLRAGLHDKSSATQMICVEILIARSPDPPSLLLDLLRDQTLKDSGLSWIFERLADYQEPSILPRLALLLQDPRPDFRGIVAGALARFGPAAEPVLLQALHDKEYTVRFDVIEALGRCGTAASVQPLVELAEQGDWAIQFRVIDALDRLDTVAREGLYHFAGSTDVKVREAAVSALANEPDARSREIVAAAGLDLEPAVRIAALPDPSSDPAPALPRLYAALRDPDSGVRQAALLKLTTTLPGEEAIDLLIPLLDDPDGEIQGYAALLLGEFRAARAGDALLARLRRPGYPAEVVLALGWQRDARAIPDLIALISAPAIGEKDGKPVSYEDQSLATMMLWTHRYAYEALVRIGEPAVDPLIVAANSTDPLAQRRALETLGTLHDPRALNTLMAAAKDPDPAVHLAVLKALHQQGDVQAFPIFIEALKNPDEKIRIAAAEGLPGCQDPAIIPPVATLLRSKEVGTRVIAAEVLANMDDARVVPYCITALRDKSQDVREAIMKGGGLWSRDPRAVKAFFDGLARTADDRLGTAFALSLLPSDLVIPGLLRAVKSRNKDERYAASRALGMHHDSRASRALVAALSGTDEDVREQAEYWLKDWCAPEALPQLRELAVNARKPDVQLSAVNILLAVDPTAPQILAGLRALAAQTRSEDVRSEAIALLRHRGLPGSAEVLRELLCTPEPDPNADLGALGASRDPRVVPILLKALRDRERSIRREAADGLGAFTDPQVGRELLAFMQAPENDAYVCAAAARSLGKIKDPASVEPLIAMLQDEWTAKSSIRALGDIGDQRAVEPLRALLPANPLQVFDGTRRSSDSRFFLTAAALMKLGDPRGAEALLSYLNAFHNAPVIALLTQQSAIIDMQNQCIIGLGKQHDPRAIDACTEACRRSPTNRYAIAALGRIGGDRAVDVLLGLVDTIQMPGEGTFDHVEAALKTITTEHLQEKLAVALRNPRWYVRLCAVLVLSDRSEPWAVPLLESVLADPQPQVRMTARAMLEDKRNNTASRSAEQE